MRFLYQVRSGKPTGGASVWSIVCIKLATRMRAAGARRAPFCAHAASYALALAASRVTARSIGFRSIGGTDTSAVGAALDFVGSAASWKALPTSIFDFLI